jgi:hypothetical protein
MAAPFGYLDMALGCWWIVPVIIHNPMTFKYFQVAG